MLTSISPLGERARHNRWAVTVSWYLAGSVAAAASTGGLLGWAGSLAGAPLAARAGLLAFLAVVAAAADAAGVRVPGPHRQVDEDWLNRYRGSVYGAAFGAQLGAGVATIVTTATTWLYLAAALLSGSWVIGALIGVAFGALRAVPLLGARGVSSWAELQRRHATLDHLAPMAGRLTVAGAGAAAAGGGARGGGRVVRISSHGLSVVPPAGWEATIYLRPPGPGEETHPVLHAATVPLPAGRGDYGSGLVESLGPSDVFVALLDFGPGHAGTPLFGGGALPGLTPDMYRPKALQRVIAGQAGVQRFFTAGGRGFCLYSVVGSYALRQALCARANQVLGSLEVAALDG